MEAHTAVAGRVAREGRRGDEAHGLGRDPAAPERHADPVADLGGDPLDVGVQRVADSAGELPDASIAKDVGGTRLCAMAMKRSASSTPYGYGRGPQVDRDAPIVGERGERFPVRGRRDAARRGMPRQGRHHCCAIRSRFPHVSSTIAIVTGHITAVRGRRLFRRHHRQPPGAPAGMSVFFTKPGTSV